MRRRRDLKKPGTQNDAERRKALRDALSTSDYPGIRTVIHDEDVEEGDFGQKVSRDMIERAPRSEERRCGRGVGARAKRAAFRNTAEARWRFAVAGASEWVCVSLSHSAHAR